MGAGESSLLGAYRLQSTDGSPLQTSTRGSFSAGSGAGHMLLKTTLFDAVHKATGVRSTIFRLSTPTAALAKPGDMASASPKHAAAESPSAETAPATPEGVLANAVKRLRTVRHPGIIKFVTAESRSGEALIVTEHVQRLAPALSSMSEEDICIGLYNLLKTIDFLHSLGICHNNIQLESVFLTDDQKWVIGGMEFACEFGQITPEFVMLLRGSLPEYAIAPEDMDETLDKSLVKARDCYALGNLISSIIAPMLQPDRSTQNASLFSWKQLQDIADRMASRQPALRPTVHDVLDSLPFRNSIFLEITERFIKEIRVIPSEFKLRMFSQLFTKLHCLPSSTVNEFLLPMLLNHELLGEPGAIEFFAELLSPVFITSNQRGATALLHNSNQDDPHIITREAYAKYVIPFLRRSFAMRQYETRVFLLRALDRYIDAACDVDEDLFESIILPELILGFDEVDDTIYTLSVSGLARVVPKYCQLLSDRKQRNNEGDHAPTNSSGKVVSAVAPLSAQTDKPISRDGRTKGRNPSATSATAGSSAAHGSRGIVDIAHASSDTTGRSASASKSAANANNYNPLLGSDMDLAAEYSPRMLVDSMLIPHVLRICVSEQIEVESVWVVLDTMASSWKQLCLIGTKSKVYDPADVARIVRSIIKCFHLIMRILPAEQKIDFFCQRLCGGVETQSEVAVVWIPKAIELAIPFLKDDNRDVRQHVNAAVNKMLLAMSIALDRAPTIARKRDASGLTVKLRRAYGQMTRMSNMFPRLGPKISGKAPMPKSSFEMTESAPSGYPFSSIPMQAGDSHAGVSGSPAVKSQASRHNNSASAPMRTSDANDPDGPSENVLETADAGSVPQHRKAASISNGASASIKRQAQTIVEKHQSTKEDWDADWDAMFEAGGSGGASPHGQSQSQRSSEVERSSQKQTSAASFSMQRPPLPASVGSTATVDVATPSAQETSPYAITEEIATSPTRTVFSDGALLTRGLATASSMSSSGYTSHTTRSEKYVNRDAINQKREAKHAETLRRKSSSPGMQSVRRISGGFDDVQGIGTIVTAYATSPTHSFGASSQAYTVRPASTPLTRPERVSVPVLHERTAQPNTQSNQDPRSLAATKQKGSFNTSSRSLTGGVRIMNVATDRVLAELGELANGSFAHSPNGRENIAVPAIAKVTIGGGGKTSRLSFSGSGVNITDAMMGWGEEDLDRDLELDDVRL